MNPFSNANVTVTRHTTGSKDTVLKENWYEEKVRKEKLADIDHKIAEKQKAAQVKENMSATVNTEIRKQRAFNKIHEIAEEAKEVTFAKILTEMYTKSLLLDQDFIDEKRPQLEGFVLDYAKSNGGYKYLEKRIKAHPNVPVLKAIKECCDSIGKMVYKDKYDYVMEAGNSVEPDDLEFSFDKDCDEKYNEIHPDIDQLSQAVKDKVITVIKDEKERQAQAKEDQEEFNAMSNEDKAMAEAAQLINRERLTEVPTMFNAIMRSSYKEMLESLTQGITADVTPTLEMDQVLAESVAKYTLLEMANTIYLEDFNSTIAESMITKMMRK